MSKIKIEIDLDINFQEFFDNIPENLYKIENKEGTDEYYEKEAISKILNDYHLNALKNHMNWMTKNNYEYAKHHLLIDEEIGKQIANNFKIISYSK